MKTAVIGAGSWGTALATVLCTNGHDTVLWARNPEVAREINQQHTNRKYLGETNLPRSLEATTDLAHTAESAEIVIFAVPSAGMAEVIHSVKDHLDKDALLAHAVKGFDFGTKSRMSELILADIPDAHGRLCVISGPSHAEEVVALLPTTIVVAAYKRQAAERLQDALMNHSLRVYTNPDVVGAELGGCLKNIIALGVGVADGLGFGDNAKAALMTRGLAEIARLGMKLGAAPLTFAGLSGVGDLIVTCTSRHSRNFRAGRLLGQGFTLDAALHEIGMVVEGVMSTKATLAIARQAGVEMPITEATYAVLFDGKSPAEAVADLMGRERAHEIEEVARELLSPKWD